MKCKDAKMIWNTDPNRFKVLTFKDYDDEKTYMYSGGCCLSDWVKMAKDLKTALIMCHRTYLYLTLHCGMDPQMVHEELLKIDEYREGMKDHIPGVMFD